MRHGRVTGPRKSKWGCVLCLPSSSVEAFLTPNANYMSSIHTTYHERPIVGDGTMARARLIGPIKKRGQCRPS
ncbi:hypothetical protein HZH68_009799 [Vespula germanica]|uniref:Uncharacterized protein n=2 Tax=Vespula TaxID=7451 RepID=A0A834N5I1_VESGE|nr:hypothetical protein HZH68_009799 [Vespula germanica]KAF7420077.1 hypothetical protein H0235_010374 [Vespula pensylvanica]